MPSEPKDLVALTNAVRQCSRALRALGDELHADLGLNVPLRALIEFVHEKQAVTYKQIAETRMARPADIETMVRDLVKLGFARLLEPGLKGLTPIVQLTPKGVATVSEIHRRERSLAAEMAHELKSDTARQTTADLARLTHILADMVREFRSARG